MDLTRDVAPELVFEAFAPDGTHYQVLSNGEVLGFPRGTLVVNYWVARENALRGESDGRL